jgi:hypothetical protein
LCLMSDMMLRRSSFSTCVLEGKAMVAGGYTKDNMMVNTDGEVCGKVDFWILTDIVFSGAKLMDSVLSSTMATWSSSRPS